MPRKHLHVLVEEVEKDAVSLLVLLLDVLILEVTTTIKLVEDISYYTWSIAYRAAMKP